MLRVHSWFKKGRHVKRWISTLQCRDISECHWLMLLNLFVSTLHETFDNCSCMTPLVFIPLLVSQSASNLGTGKWATHHLEFVILCFPIIYCAAMELKKTWLLFLVRKSIRVFRVNLLKLQQGRSFPRFLKPFVFNSSGRLNFAETDR